MKKLGQLEEIRQKVTNLYALVRNTGYQTLIHFCYQWKCASKYQKLQTDIEYFLRFEL